MPKHAAKGTELSAEDYATDAGAILDPDTGDMHYPTGEPEKEAANGSDDTSAACT